jgi:hypothetical protein
VGARADRMPPAELVDLVLHESAYGVELRGARFQSARNLKNSGAPARIQNRGYAPWAASARTSTGWRSATSRTRRSTPPTP